MSILSEQLKYLRNLNGFTQDDLASRLKVNQSTYANWENGLREPNCDTLIKLSKIYDVSIDFLILGFDKINKREPINSSTITVNKKHFYDISRNIRKISVTLDEIIKKSE